MLDSIFEIIRKTKTEIKSNKEERNYKYQDGQKTPRTKKEYNKQKEQER